MRSRSKTPAGSTGDDENVTGDKRQGAGRSKYRTSILEFQTAASHWRLVVLDLSLAARRLSHVTRHLMTPDTLHSTPDLSENPISASSSHQARLSVYAGFVKLSHSLFSLPLLFAGALLAGRHALTLALAGWILLAGLGARTTGMAFNRIIDRWIDAKNPRTASRALPQGTMRPVEAWLVAAAGAILYIVAAAAISPLCLTLSPIPLALFALYPYLKRFTVLSHIGLGIAWSTAPLGGWVAATDSASMTPSLLWLAAFSICWVAGFDIIYATMDEAFDRAHGLHSLPALLGSERALAVSRLLHLMAFGCLIGLWQTLGHAAGALPITAAAILFIAEHRLRDRGAAFFPVNVLIGCAVLALVATAPPGAAP